MVIRARASPERYSFLTYFLLNNIKLQEEREKIEALSVAKPDLTLNTTVTSPNLVSNFERTHYYHGISPNPPELMYRSDLETRPFPVPQPGEESYELPTKAVTGTSNTPLHSVWDELGRTIYAQLKDRGIKVSVLDQVRFSTTWESAEGWTRTLSPVVIWIATHPGTTTAEQARDASPDILRVLAEHDDKTATVEWYEAEIVRLIDRL